MITHLVIGILMVVVSISTIGTLCGHQDGTSWWVTIVDVVPKVFVILALFAMLIGGLILAFG